MYLGQTLRFLFNISKYCKYQMMRIWCVWIIHRTLETLVFTQPIHWQGWVLNVEQLLAQKDQCDWYYLFPNAHLWRFNQNSSTLTQYLLLHANATHFLRKILGSDLAVLEQLLKKPQVKRPFRIFLLQKWLDSLYKQGVLSYSWNFYSWKCNP